MNNAVVYLMYHELLLPARATADTDAGYLRYLVAADTFRAQLAHLRAENFRVLSVADALAEDLKASATPDAGMTAAPETGTAAASDPQMAAAGGTGRATHAPRVVLTFDDGCETDLLAAAPMLREAGYNATFYVTAGHVGRRGYLSVGQLKELAAQGFDIGCHSMTHSLLTDLGEERLRTEIVEAKQRLEDLTGARVANFSCPGGRWNRRIADLARAAGYDSVATSRIGANSAATDRFCLSRVAVMRGTSLAEFARFCRGEGLWKRRAQDGALAFAKKALGNAAYQKFRSNLLGRKSAATS